MSSNKNIHRSIKYSAFKISFIYIIFGLAWIYTSDTIVEFFIKNPDILYQINVVKGFAYVLITGYLVYSLIARLIKLVEKKEDELINSKEELYQLAFIDQRSNLSNRQRLIKDLQQINKSNVLNIGLINFDIDNFTYYNDTLGHDVGDQILLYLGFVLSDKELNYQAYQTGGDEFVILLKNIDSESLLQKTFDSLIQNLSEQLHNQFDIHGFSITAGGIFTDTTNMNINTVLNNLDVARIFGKQTNKGTLQIYQEDFTTNHKNLIELKNDIDYAIEHQKFTMNYQPQYNYETNKIIGFEALIRWNKDGQFIPPSTFIPFSETSKQIIPIGLWVFEEVLKTIQNNHDILKDDYLFSINLSPVQLSDLMFPNNYLEILSRYDVNPKQIQLEITETVLVEYSEEIVHKLSPLRMMGVKIALDDFGIGYSNFSYLDQIEFDTIKLDRYFIQDIDTAGDRRKQLLKGVMTVGSVYADELIAEGVETEGEVSYIRELGLHIIQGYVFARPQPFNKIKSQLKK